MLNRRKPEPPRGFSAEWPVRNQSPIAGCDAQGLLKDELSAYLQGLARGRSFLIAGHRGAGKTFLVRNAAESLHFEFFRDADPLVKAKGSDPAWVYQQRPLLVQIHGPSLLSEPEGGGEDKARELAAKILAQIMIALYRAVATEFAEAFVEVVGQDTKSAPAGQRHQRHARRARFLELAAQFRLDLDMGTGPAQLREYWRLAGRLPYGILWPNAIGMTRGPGQGVTEIVALASAAQAFRVCVGKVTQEHSISEDASRFVSAEMKTADGNKDFTDKLLSLAVGGTVAAGTFGLNHVFAALAGAASTLVSSIGLTLSAKRASRSERKMNYKFLPDRSLETLERDLPLVIQRLRDAGLAPVFVIDELDKLPMELNPYDRIGQMIERLKLLTTDHGFFCFLADRPYYDLVQAKALTKGFAREHTNFSHRVMVNYTARDFRRFIYENLDYGNLRKWLEDPVKNANLKTDDGIKDALIFAREIVHKSELNFIEVSRRLAASWGHDKVNARFDPQGAESQLHCIVQLAIDRVWGGGALPARAAQDQSFAQLATDALYLISRRWREDARAELDLNTNDIMKYLLRRMIGDRGEDTARRAAALDDYDLSPSDRRILVDAVRLLAELLSDFNVLKVQLTDGAGGHHFAAEDEPLLALFDPPPGSALLARVGVYKYRFLFDEFGITITPRDGMRPGDPIPPATRDLVKPLVDFMALFGVILPELTLNFDTLLAAGALPSVLPWANVPDMISRLDAALQIGEGYYEMTTDFDTLERCRDELVNRSRPLSLSLQLGVAIAMRAKPFLARLTETQSLGSGCNIAPLARQLGELWASMGRADPLARLRLATMLEDLLPKLPNGKHILQGNFDSIDRMKIWRGEINGWRDATRPMTGAP